MEDCMRKLVSIVIPCYRSAEMIGGVVADINREMEKLQEKYRWEIILVNDCSPDNTFDAVSYTHLDVYNRQGKKCASAVRHVDEIMKR